MTHRIERINSLIRQEISELLRHEIKDPQLGSLIAVNEVATSPDLRYAKVFVSCICSEEEKQEMLKVLTAAAGFLRNELTRRVRIRRIPELSFEWDDSIERGAHLLQLIDKVSSESVTDLPSD